MEIINDHKNDKYSDMYTLFVILSLITFKKLRK
ncbi:hypothetical protein J2Z83_003058 [Virgibacillus natechei]|uniref:Transposase n=1 Tax=Virgibacillus natechei TaxID=1216297 RepID=A0ABS4IJ02_9BACI|nr:hypothetical protein [Virgibacillus natechei]